MYEIQSIIALDFFSQISDFTCVASEFKILFID